MKKAPIAVPTTPNRLRRHRQQDAFALSLALVPAHGGAPQQAPRPLRNTLIVAEADCFNTWRESVAAVLPSARVIEIHRIEDLDRPAEVYLLLQRFLPLARPELRLLSGSCPRCGEPIRQPYSGEPRGSHCPGKLRLPANLPTRLAQDLAAMLVVSHRVGEGSRLVTPSLLERARRVPLRRVSPAALASFESRVLSREAEVRAGTPSSAGSCVVAARRSAW